MKHTVTYNHQSQFIELIRDCQTYLSISDLSLNFLKGITPTYVESSCVEVINQACVTWDGIDFSNVKYQNSESSFAKGILNSDDLLLTMTGRGTLGRCNIFFPENDDITYIADSHISILRVNKTLVLPIIIAKFISLSDTQDEIYRNYVTGSTNQLDIVFSKIKNFKIPVPPMALQEEFAAIVSQADKSKFDGFKSQFLEWFGNPFLSPKNGESVSITDVADIVLGTTPNSKIKEYWDGELKWITPAEIEEESFIISDTVRHITEDGRNSANLTLLPVGSVLFSTRAPIGKVAIAGEEMYCNQGFKNFICKPELNNVFLYYTLRLNKEYLVSLGTGTTFKELSKKIVESIKISVPAKEQQEQFERVFRQSDKSKYYVQNKQNYICHILTNQIQ